MINLKALGLASGMVAASAVAASAGLIDFTDSSVGLTGATDVLAADGVSFITYEVTASSFDNYGGNETPLFISSSPPAPAGVDITPLKGDNDGLGVNDGTIFNDEGVNYISTSGTSIEAFTIEFSQAVKLTTAYFLDVFFSDSGTEAVGISVGDSPTDPAAVVMDANIELLSPDSGGFLAVDAPADLFGTSFTFFAAGTSSDDGTNDIAFAGVSVSAVPLPAGVLLLGTALAGFGFAGRRKKS